MLTYAYDGNGNVLSVTDALGHKTSYQYDALNRVTKMVDTSGGITQYAYDAGDHLTRVIDPRGLVTTYSYDGLGLLWSETSPDTGTTSFTYDAYGRLASKKLSGGTVQSFTYDALNRLTGATADAFSQSWTYDNCTKGLGRLCSVSDGNTTTSYSYSAEGWVVGRGFNVGGNNYALGFSYDQVGRMTVVYYPDGNTASFYNYKGSIFQVALNVAGTAANAATNIGYRPGNLAMSSWTSGNGLTNTINYDNDLRPTSITVPGVQSLSFTYDAADRITKITNGTDATMTQTLGYDALNRLTSVSSGAENESYLYDADGNRLSQTVNGVATTFAPDSGSNRLLSRSSGGTTVSYKYDPEGDVASYGDGTQPQMFYYTGFDRLNGTYIGGVSTHFDVNPEGQRLRKYTSTTSTYFAPDVSGNLLAEETNGAWTDYVWLNGRLIAVLAKGQVYSVHDDQTGRPQVMTEPNGTSIDWAAQNKPFDRTVTTNAWGSFNVGFPGQYYDSEDSLWYNGHRDYDPNGGRYIEPDPLGLGGGINPYVYADNNPISNIDPLGLCKCQNAGNAPSPQQYQAVGQTLGTISMLGGASGIGFNLGALTEFRRGGVLDAQRYGGSPAYANYAFGVEMSANGASLGATLGAANAYGALRSSYPASVPMDPNYSSIPASNVANITQGYNDQQNGTLCTSGGG